MTSHPAPSGEPPFVHGLSLRTVRWGLFFALLAIAFGFAMGVLFGAAEASLKTGLEADGRAVLATAYGGEEARLRQVLDKSWVYLQRAHLHGGGIGAVAVALCLLLATLGRAALLRSLAALALGVGALGYAVYWLLAGLRAPGLGGTAAAKDSLQWLALPASTLAVVGLLTTIVLFKLEILLPLRSRPPAR